MQALSPHFLLYSEATIDGGSLPRWKFVLQSVGSNECFSAADAECETRASRLELLAVVRGLEALNQPSRVTLLTRSRYVSRGIRREINQWRDRRWRWERFGKLVPIRDHDLWQRVDRALEFHKVECCGWQIDQALAIVPAAEAASRKHELARSVVRRGVSRGHWQRWSFRGTLRRLSHGVLTPFSAILRPAFTKAA